MLVVLPPSETKTPGGTGAPLELDALGYAELNPMRRKLADALVALAADRPASRTALDISERQDEEIDRNAALWQAPCLPALARYTGVLFDALDVKSMRRTEFARAAGRIAIGSALFGIVGGRDEIPAYRLSAGSALPGIGGLRAFWRPALEPLLSEVDELTLDLRSAPYAALGEIAHAVTVQVVSEAGGRRTTISHANKAHKGRLARVLATHPRELRTVGGVRRLAAAAGMRLEQSAPGTLDLVI